MDISVLTVAVRASDGAIFHMEKTKKKQFNRLATGSIDKWIYVIRHMKKHNHACKVRLLVGLEEDGVPMFEELIYRPIVQPAMEISAVKCILPKRLIG